MNTEQQMANDLDLIDATEVLGTKSAVRKARKQRKVIFAHLKAMNAADGLDTLSDDELLAQLTEV